MTVKQLIAKLKKMPQNLEVGFSSSDNSEYEISDWPTKVWLFDKKEIPAPDWINDYDRECYDGLPDKAVVIHG